MCEGGWRGDVGSIPGELGGLGKVQIVRLDGNKLTGEGEWNPLRSGNNPAHDAVESGSIPEALGALSVLKVLAVHDNKLTGSIPRELGGLGKLEQLWLNGNELSGSIPGELGGLGKVQIVRLDGNKLTGSIPEALGALSELKVLAMHDNKLTGSIPRELGGLGKLEQLWLYGNELTGKGELTSMLRGISAYCDALFGDPLCVFESLSWIGACYGALAQVCSWFVT
ncbi:unnamed protein product [Ectocarpus sp. CCAP 1310/34]|nr:unnamed protein product [Ectocarpus sp. CCAP 1310/34]